MDHFIEQVVGVHWAAALFPSFSLGSLVPGRPSPLTGMVATSGRPRDARPRSSSVSSSLRGAPPSSAASSSSLGSSPALPWARRPCAQGSIARDASDQAARAGGQRHCARVAGGDGAALACWGGGAVRLRRAGGGMRLAKVGRARGPAGGGGRRLAPSSRSWQRRCQVEREEATVVNGKGCGNSSGVESP